VGLERGPIILVRTTEELLERKSSDSGPESLEYSHGDSSSSSRGTLHPQNLAVTSPTSGGRSVGIVRSRTKATEFIFSLVRKLSQFYTLRLLTYIWRTSELVKRDIRIIRTFNKIIKSNKIVINTTTNK
jgi:hypothetical protein